MSYRYILGHQSMVFDDLRNTYYRDAVHKFVSSDSVVMDLGAGIGIHGLMAASAGAKKVYLIEPQAELDVAVKVAQLNNLEDKIECVPLSIEEANIADKVDLILSVFTGNFLLEEDLLPSLFYARDKFLRADGAMAPDRAYMEVVPVIARSVFEKNISRWSERVQGLDYSNMRQYAANHIYYDNHSALKEEFLAEPVKLFELDFMTASSAGCDAAVDITIEKDGLCHGCLGWFKTRIGDQWLSTSPTDKKTHWSQAFLPLDPPLQVKSGETIRFELKRPEFGEWTWAVTAHNNKQRHSTFMSGPLSTDYLLKKSESNKAQLNKLGEIARQVLNRLNGTETTIAITADIFETYPEVFPNKEHAKQFVIRQIERFC